MTLTPQRRTLLPLAGPHGSRSWATCHYRCGNACDQPEPNTSGHEHVSSVIATAVRRRSLLGGAAALGAGALVLSGAAGPATASGVAAPPGQRTPAPSTDRWTPVAPNVRDTVTVPDGYRTRLVAAWGDPVLPGAPDFDPYRQTPESAAMQFGYNNDYVGVLPLDRRSALLLCNH
jgi:secreted PhoX family phosphatase